MNWELIISSQFLFDTHPKKNRCADWMVPIICSQNARYSIPGQLSADRGPQMRDISDLAIVAGSVSLHPREITFIKIRRCRIIP